MSKLSKWEEDKIEALISIREEYSEDELEDCMDEAFCDIMKQNIEFTVDDPETVADHEWKNQYFHDQVMLVMNAMIGRKASARIERQFLEHEEGKFREDDRDHRYCNDDWEYSL